METSWSCSSLPTGTQQGPACVARLVAVIVISRAAVTEPLPAAARCPMLRPPPRTPPPLGRDTDFHPHIVQGNGRSGEVDTQTFLSFMGDALTLNNLYI